jgi:cbb3-type cytochrome c oxidase subunit I
LAVTTTVSKPSRSLPRWLTGDESASLNWMLSGAVWLILGTTMGLILAVELVFPDTFAGVPFLVFSRLRQAHVNTVLFAWLSVGMVGLWFYIVPRLTGRKLWSELLGNITMILWNVAVITGIVLIVLGNTQSREYAELVWPVDVAVMICLLLVLVNTYMTIARRTDAKMYVSLWYIIGTSIWFPALYFIGNVMWNPPTGALTGIDDSLFNWVYGHNVLGLWFTTGLLPVIYYIVPRETKTPLYGHFLSLIAFWSIALFYTGVGAHHLLWAPIPTWLKTTAVAESIGMILPVIAFFANIYLTTRGNWSRLWSSIPLRFVWTGFAAYIIVSLQGTQQALRSVNLITHFTQYVPGHAHLALLFFSASVIMGGIYYAVPAICKCQLFSRKWANIQYAMYVVGFTFFFLGFFLTGLIQGANWVNEGLPVWTTLYSLRNFMALRIVGGIPLYLSFVIFTANILLTWLRRKPAEEPELPVQTPVAPRDVRGREVPQA